ILPRFVFHVVQRTWNKRCGVNEIWGAVSVLFCPYGTATCPQAPPIIPLCDNVVGWLGTVGILAALRRRAGEGGSYRVTVSLTRTVLWLLSPGIFAQDYRPGTAGASDQQADGGPAPVASARPGGTQ